MIEMDVDAAQHELDTLNLNSPPARPMAHLLPSFEALPPELLEQIAFQLCRQTPHGPPTALLSLLCAGRSFYDVLGPRNEGFYADLFKERFDWRSAERRWKVMRDIEGKREKRMLLDEVSEVRADADLVLNPAGSFTRSSSPTASEYVPTSSSPWRDLTSKDLALEFKRRNTVLTRMRTAVLSGMIPPSSSRPNTPRAGSPRLSPMTPTGNFKLPVLEPDELTQNLWTCYLMLLENDSKNLAHLVEYGLLRTYMKLFYKHSLLSEALRPGWPRQSAGRALGLWIGWLAGDDISTESSSESDERFFVLKPYVFGAHKFDAYHAPWTIRTLPVTTSSHPLHIPAPMDPFLADLRPKTQAQAIVHMGRTVEIAPPILTHAAIFSFFFRVERDPGAMTDLIGANLGAPLPPGIGAPGVHGVTTGKPAKTSRPLLQSKVHDQDFARLVSCVDPYSSRGLPPLFCTGQISGSWEGRFSFFDFDSYRDMLGGRMRSLYEGPFGDQPQVWKLEEQVVKIDNNQVRGGKGPILNAGFELGLPGPRPSFSTSLSATSVGGSSASAAVPAPSSSSSLDRSSSNRRKSIELGDGNSTLAGDARTSKRPRSIQENSWDDLEMVDEEDDEFEILLTGSGHSAWGQFLLKGRIRAYDGLFSITKEYTPDSRGRWLYRGYCVGGNLVGRWRDTHTPIDMSGYEGTFLMTRRA